MWFEESFGARKMPSFSEMHECVTKKFGMTRDQWFKARIVYAEQDGPTTTSESAASM
jgi:hypothetical protein